MIDAAFVDALKMYTYSHVIFLKATLLLKYEYFETLQQSYWLFVFLD